MTENVENSAANGQENSQKSENIQQNSEINVETPPAESGSEGQDTGKEESLIANEENEDGDLPLPEPDLPQDEAKKKKDQPEWMKRKLERERRKEAERLAAENAEKERLRHENELLKAKAGQPPENIPQNQPADPYMPRRDQFATEGEYFIALTDYRDARRAAEHQQRQRVAEIQKHEQRFQSELQNTIEEGKTKYKDFEERTDFILYGDGFPSNRGMAEAIVDSKYRDDILYFLGTNEKEALRIANLNPISAAKEIAKIEGRFESKRKSNIPKAPNPLSPVSGGKGTAIADPHKLAPGDDFRRWYEEKYGR